MATPGGSSPWVAHWSPQHNAHYFVNMITNETTWQPPMASPPQPTQGSAPYGPYGPYGQQPYSGQPSGTPSGALIPSPDPRGPVQNHGQGLGQGLMGKWNSLGSGSQVALAVGGGMLAGGLMDHELHHLGRHHGHHGFGLGTSLEAGAIGAAGGFLTGKLFGNKQQQAPAQAPAPAPMPPQQYQGYPPGPGYGPGYGPGPGPLHAPGYAQGPFPAHAGGYGPPPQEKPPPPYSTAPARDYPPGHQPFNNATGAYEVSGGHGNSHQALHIHAAAWGDKDVTAWIRSMVDPLQQLHIKLENEGVQLLGNPWPEVDCLTLSVLYKYGDRPMELMVATSRTGIFQIKQEAISKARMDAVNQMKDARIFCLTWGSVSVMTPARVSILETDGEMEASGLGNGEWYPWQKRTLQCFYRTEKGEFAVACVREGGTLRLPWNPLAKWS